MNTYPYAGTVSRTLPRRRSVLRFRRLAASPTTLFNPIGRSTNGVHLKDWEMLNRIGWLSTASIVGLLIWQTAATDPVWPPAVSGLLLVVIGVLAGLRIGADSAAAYLKDLHRLNKVFAEQNQQLQDANTILLNEVNSRSTVATKSACIEL